jgi:hypothetical protein
MMTFIVTGDFVVNASFLDTSRVCKQVVEANQILNTLLSGGSWSKHPIVKSWDGFINALKYYINCVVLECLKRGYDVNPNLYEIKYPIIMPWWTQWSFLHQSHRAMLIRKNPFHYAPLFTNKYAVDITFFGHGYIWPSDMNINYVNTFDKLTTNDLPDLCAVIPKDLVNPRFCSAILGSGKRVNQTCNILLRDESCFCKRHIKNN